ncbi:MAG: class I SAM-dependent methyltransferase [Acidimicrobiales bacterium]
MYGVAPVYDRIGATYAKYRRPDPRIAMQLDRALGDAKTVLNVGAGTGSYELAGRRWVAVEPSDVMLAQRGPDASPTVKGIAEHLPFADKTFDAATAIFTVHHWTDAAAGLAELRRVTRGPMVVLTWDVELSADYWLLREYAPEAQSDAESLVCAAETLALLGDARVEVVAVPHDCTDGFFACYWRRPEMYLDPDARAAISGLALLPPEIHTRLERALRADLESGAWRARHADLLGQDSYDAGYRLVISPA